MRSLISTLLVGMAVAVPFPFTGPGLLEMGAPAMAFQISCPSGYHPVAVPGGWTCGNQGAWRPGPSALDRFADEIARNPPPLPPPEPRRSIDTSGAVAWHPRSKEVWVTWNQRNERLAQSLVMEACNATMNGGCQGRWVTNGYMAVATDQNGAARTGAGESAAEARSLLQSDCVKNGVHCGDIKIFKSLPLSEPERYTAVDRAAADDAQVMQEYAYPAISKIASPKAKLNRRTGFAGKTKDVAQAPTGHRLIHEGSDGKWYLPARRPGDSCGMYYMSGEGDMLLWFGPTAGTNGAFGVVSSRIPLAKKQEWVDINLRAHDGAAAAKALHMPWNRNQGILLLPVKMRETLQNTDDVSQFEVSMGGTTVYTAEFSGNHKARAEMLRCMDADLSNPAAAPRGKK